MGGGRGMEGRPNPQISKEQILNIRYQKGGGGEEWREGEILKFGGDKSSIFPYTNRGWVAKGKMGWEGKGARVGEGARRGGGGRLQIYDISENESQNHNATKVGISCPNVKLLCKARSQNLDFVHPTSKWKRLLMSVT